MTKNHRWEDELRNQIDQINKDPLISDCLKAQMTHSATEAMVQRESSFNQMKLQQELLERQYQSMLQQTRQNYYPAMKTLLSPTPSEDSKKKEKEKLERKEKAKLLERTLRHALQVKH